MAAPDLDGFLSLVPRHRVTHTFLPPTLIYMLLAHEKLASTGLSSLRCLWYGAAPMSPARPGSAGQLLATGERGEIVVRCSLVMARYHKNPEATAEASAHGWHHTGDIGCLDEDGFLFIVDRAKDMVITGGFNVYSAEVDQALMAHSGASASPRCCSCSRGPRSRSTRSARS